MKAKTSSNIPSLGIARGKRQFFHPFLDAPQQCEKKPLVSFDSTYFSVLLRLVLQTSQARPDAFLSLFPSCATGWIQTNVLVGYSS